MQRDSVPACRTAAGDGNAGRLGGRGGAGAGKDRGARRRNTKRRLTGEEEEEEYEEGNRAYRRGRRRRRRRRRRASGRWSSGFDVRVEPGRGGGGRRKEGIRIEMHFLVFLDGSHPLGNR